MPELLRLLLIALFAALVNGVTGFGFGLVAMPVLAATMPLSQAVVIVNFVALFACSYNLWSVRQHVNWRETWPILGSAFPGAVLGLFVLKLVPEPILLTLLGATLVLGCLVALWSPKRALIRGAWPWGYVAGVLGGVLGGALATGGPPVVLYCLARGWNKEEQKSVFSSYFAIIAVWRLVLLVAGDLVTWPMIGLGALALLPALGASMLGGRIFRRMSLPAFRYATLALLLAMAVRLVVS